MAPDLGLDLKLSTSKFVTCFFSSPIPDGTSKIVRLEECLTNLEDERRKIGVFKNELPLCMLLLNNVIDGMKEEVDREKTREEVLGLKRKLADKGGVKMESDYQDKMNWMSSAQLWSDNCSDVDDADDDCNKNNQNEGEKKPDFGGTFLPFKPFSCTSSKVEGEKPAAFCSEIHHPEPISRCQVASPASSHVSPQCPRKARRCWSPELHHRFVAALEQLGGAQVATPKQIRELMKVDGLTNDEVKSHLQKFRLHTKRAPNPSSVVIMGRGLWAASADKDESSSQSGSPQGPLQLALTTNRAGESCDDDGKSESYSWK